MGCVIDPVSRGDRACSRVTRVNVSVSPEAERELIDGAAFYAERAERELGLAFIAEFEHARDLLSTNPEIGAQWNRNPLEVLIKSQYYSRYAINTRTTHVRSNAASCRIKSFAG